MGKGMNRGGMGGGRVGKDKLLYPPLQESGRVIHKLFGSVWKYTYCFISNLMIENYLVNRKVT